MNLTISAPSISLSISMLFRIHHVLSLLTGPNIFLSICLSKMHRLFTSFAVKVWVSNEYVTTGLIIVLYIFILVFFLSNFDFISFALAWTSGLKCVYFLLLDMFSKLWKSTFSFVMAVHLCIHLSAQNNTALPGWIFMKFDILRIFLKMFWENSSFIKIWQE